MAVMIQGNEAVAEAAGLPIQINGREEVIGMALSFSPLPGYTKKELEGNNK